MIFKSVSFFFFIFSVFSFQSVNGSVFLKESIHFTRSLKLVPQSFKQLAYSSTPYKYEKNYTSFALLALGACGISLMNQDDVKCEGKNTEFENMIVEACKKIEEIEKKSKEKELVFLMGASKGGKSFIAKNLIGKTIEEIKSEEKGTDQNKSQTLYPDIFCKDEFCFCDPPAFSDIGRGEDHKLLVSVMLRCALKSGTDRKARLMLLLPPSLFGVSRAETIFKQIFDTEFFPLLDTSIFSKKGILFVFNNSEGKETPLSYYNEKLGSMQKGAQDLLQSAKNPSSNVRPENVIKTVQICEFYLNGVKKISSGFVDYNLTTHEDIFKRLRELQPFNFNLKSFGGDIAKLANIWDEGQSLNKSIEQTNEKIRLIELENQAIDSILKRTHLIPTTIINKISDEGNNLKKRLNSLSEARDKFYKERGVIRTLNEGRKIATLHEWGFFWWNKYTQVTIENLDRKPFGLPVIIWINGTSYQLSPDTNCIPDGLQERTIDPDAGSLKLVYKIPFTSKDVDVWAQIEMTDSEPGIALIRSKELKLTADEINSTKKLIEANENLLKLIKDNKLTELKSLNKNNLDMLEEHKKTIGSLNLKYFEKKNVFDAANGLIKRLF